MSEKRRWLVVVIRADGTRRRRYYTDRGLAFKATTKALKRNPGARVVTMPGPLVSA